jgi:hypothetical protein
MSETKRPHGSRFRDALVIINPGACNPSGVALSIADACREMREHENVEHQKHLPGSRDPADGLPTRASVRRCRPPVRPCPLHERRGRLQGTPRRTRSEALRGRLTITTLADRSWQGSGRWKYPTGEIPMPKFVIERQYLVPMYQHIIVEAENL